MVYFGELDSILRRKAREAAERIASLPAQGTDRLPQDIQDFLALAQWRGELGHDDSLDSDTLTDEDQRLQHLRTEWFKLISAEMADVATRLQAKNERLWGDYDRLRSEAEFRIGLVPPLSASFVVLAVSVSPFWLLGVAPVALLLSQGRAKQTEATKVLAGAMSAGEVQPPSLDRVDARIAEVTSLT